MAIERKTSVLHKGEVFINVTRNGGPAAKKRLLISTKLYLRREG